MKFTINTSNQIILFIIFIALIKPRAMITTVSMQLRWGGVFSFLTICPYLLLPCVKTIFVLGSLCLTCQIPRKDIILHNINTTTMFFFQICHSQCFQKPNQSFKSIIIHSKPFLFQIRAPRWCWVRPCLTCGSCVPVCCFSVCSSLIIWINLHVLHIMDTEVFDLFMKN